MWVNCQTEHHIACANIITTVKVGGDVSKFKPSSFPWTTLLVILGGQGLVLRGWPHQVLMPGQPRKHNARTKGIADLGLANQRRLYDALTEQEITVMKVNDKAELSK